MEECNDNLAQILKMFKSHVCHEESLLTKEELTKMLNKQANNKLRRDFNPFIIREIWGQAETNSRGESTMRTFAKILNNAIDILESRLYRINSPQVGIPHYQRQLQKINDKLSYLQSEYEAGFLENYQKINIERKNKVIIENKIKELRQQELDFKKEFEEIKACIYPQPPITPPQSSRTLPVRQTRVEQSQVIRAPPDPETSYSFERRPNPALFLIFQLTAVGIVLQLLVLTVKPNFLGLICYLLVMFWLFLGYYDKMFVAYVMIGFGLSILLDLIYLLLQFTGNLNTVNPTGKGLIVLIIIFLVVELALRVIIILKILPFRAPSQKEQYFHLFGQDISLKHRAGKRQTINF